MSLCNLCPYRCNIDRSKHIGCCKAPNYLKINTYLLHYGEEPVLSGTNGSGTIFFSHCQMSCIFCQNYRVSALGHGHEISADRLFEIAIEMQKKGANNINLVSPTPYTSLIIPVLNKLKKNGLVIPVVWNSNAYESVETIKSLEGLVDIYLPDFKYWEDEIEYKYSGIKNYRENAQNALREMIRQTGNLIVDDDNIAIFGTMVRLLLLPNDQNKIEPILNWLYETFGEELYISLMSQYYPAYRASEIPEMNMGITTNENDRAIHIIEKLGFVNGFYQTPATTPEWTPNFKS